MLPIQKLKVRLISPSTEQIETETAIFSKHISNAEADALLCEWAPDPELLTFGKKNNGIAANLPVGSMRYMEKSSQI